MEGDHRDLLLREIDQRNEWARAQTQAMVSWFTFFCPIVITAVAFAAQACFRDGSVKSVFPVVAVSAYYAVQCWMGFVACKKARDDLTRTYARIQTLTNALATSATSDLPAPEAAIPTGLISGVGLMGWAVLTLLPMLALACAYVLTQR